MADAAVVAHAEGDVLDVGADRLAHGGDGVDEGDLRGEERVGGVLDRLGRRRVGDDHRRGDPEVQRRHPHGGGLVLGADHDAVGVEEVVDGRALAEELGVRHHGDVAAAEGPLHDPGGADRHRRLVDDDGLARQERARSRGRPPRCRRGRPSRRGPAGWARRGRRTRSRATACAAPTTKREPAAVDPLAHEVVEARLEDRDLAPLEAARPCPRRCRRTRRRGRCGRSRRRW